MQKLTIRDKINEFSANLNSDGIIQMLQDLYSKFDSGTNPESSWNTLRLSTLQEIVKSKSNYDNVIQADNDLEAISDSIDRGIYSAENISKIVAIISNTNRSGKKSLFTNNIILEFLNYHQSISNSNSLLSTVISEDTSQSNLVLFTVVDEGNPTTQKIIAALTILQELIDLLEKLYNEEQTNTVIILDKGSNTNIGIETGVKTAGSIFEIFKEVWDWVMNRKYYKEKLKDAEFMEKLSIIQTIHQMKEDGSLEPEEALRYKTLVTRKVDELLNIDTVPRELLLKEGENKDTLILKDYNEVRLLKQGDSESDS